MTTLIQQLLEEQQDLTAVDRFSQLHAAGDLPAQQKYYSRLLPASPPAAGQQYAFNVDLDKCSGCKACVTACHNLNGLDENEAWRDVGLLIGGTPELPIMQHVTTACHHCVDPACASACPVDAYEKNPVTGIVKHLDDQCFGCQYCTLACPYDVPKYNADKGIVRKCDMCSDRLADGEAPACVQACPHEAIAIQVVDVARSVAEVPGRPLVPSSPSSDFTVPTTTYSGGPPLSADLTAADLSHLSPQHAHWPLIIMLILTQLSVGMFAVGLLVGLTPSDDAPQMPAMATAAALVQGSLPAGGSGFTNPLSTAVSLSPAAVHSAVALLLGLLALGSSTCHLGRPQYAFRAIIGLKHSWLSREIVVFGAFSGAAVTYTGLTWLDIAPPWLVTASGVATVITGLAGVACSVMIYVFTRRQFWNLSSTSARFLLTCPVLGVAGSWLTLTTFAAIAQHEDTRALATTCGPWFATTLIIATLLKAFSEFRIFRHLQEPEPTQLKRSALLMTTLLRPVTMLRFTSGLAGGILLPIMAVLAPATAPVQVMLFSLLFVGCFAGESAERFLFFTAVSPDRMPGGLQS